MCCQKTKPTDTTQKNKKKCVCGQNTQKWKPETSLKTRFRVRTTSKRPEHTHFLQKGPDLTTLLTTTAEPRILIFIHSSRRGYKYLSAFLDISIFLSHFFPAVYVHVIKFDANSPTTEARSRQRRRVNCRMGTIGI